MSKAEEWYYVDRLGKQQGPVGREALFDLSRSNEVSPSTLVWMPGQEDWKEFSFHFSGKVPPPIPQEKNNKNTSDTAHPSQPYQSQERQEKSVEKSSTSLWGPIMLWGGLLLAVMAAMFGKSIGESFNRSSNRITSDQIAEVLHRASSEVNLGVPIMIDSDTRLDRTDSGPGRKFNYYYTLVSVGAGQISEPQLQDALSDQLKNFACSEEAVNKYIKLGVSINYSYSDSSGSRIGDITVSPNDCRPGETAARITRNLMEENRRR